MPEPSAENTVQSALQGLLEAASRTRPPESPAELRLRAGRRAGSAFDAKLLLAVAAAAVVVVTIVTAGALHRSARQPTTVHAGHGASFSIRPVLCHAAPYSGSTTGTPPPRLDPDSCAPASRLSAANLDVVPGTAGGPGFTDRTDQIPTDEAFSTVPSTPAADDLPGNYVLLPSTPANVDLPAGTTRAGVPRYLLGPAGVTGGDVASARAQDTQGQWTVLVQLTPGGSARWDALAQQQFHAMVAVVVDGRVISAPLDQPTQSTFTSFDGAIQLAGSFTRAQASSLATHLAPTG